MGGKEKEGGEHDGEAAGGPLVDRCGRRAVCEHEIGAITCYMFFF